MRSPGEAVWDTGLCFPPRLLPPPLPRPVPANPLPTAQASPVSTSEKASLTRIPSCTPPHNFQTQSGLAWVRPCIQNGEQLRRQDIFRANLCISPHRPTLSEFTQVHQSPLAPRPGFLQEAKG